MGSRHPPGRKVKHPTPAGHRVNYDDRPDILAFMFVRWLSGMPFTQIGREIGERFGVGGNRGRVCGTVKRQGWPDRFERAVWTGTFVEKVEPMTEEPKPKVERQQKDTVPIAVWLDDQAVLTGRSVAANYGQRLRPMGDILNDRNRNQTPEWRAANLPGLTDPLPRMPDADLAEFYLTKDAVLASFSHKGVKERLLAPLIALEAAKVEADAAIEAAELESTQPNPDVPALFQSIAEDDLGEITVSGEEIATALGYKDPEAFNNLVGRHEQWLRQMGKAVVTENHDDLSRANRWRRRRYNEAQAMYLVSKSGLPIANDISVCLSLELAAYRHARRTGQAMTERSASIQPAIHALETQVTALKEQINKLTNRPVFTHNDLKVILFEQLSLVMSKPPPELRKVFGGIVKSVIKKQLKGESLGPDTDPDLFDG